MIGLFIECLLFDSFVGCVITLVETPYFFRLVPPNIATLVQPFFENRPPWQKAIFYTLYAYTCLDEFPILSEETNERVIASHHHCPVPLQHLDPLHWTLPRPH